MDAQTYAGSRYTIGTNGFIRQINEAAIQQNFIAIWNAHTYTIMNCVGAGALPFLI